MMDISAFQEHVKGFMNPDLSTQQQLANWSMGLAGETGETIDILKKFLFHKQPLDLFAVEKELGDVLWYVFALAITLGLDVEEIMRKNVHKLQARHEGLKINFDVAEKNKNDSY